MHGTCGSRGGIGQPEERSAVDLAEGSAVELDPGVRPDHLQVEHHSAGPDRFDHVAQDVHDVLRLYSSERPGEDNEVEGVRLHLDLLAGGNSVGNSLGELGR